MKRIGLLGLDPGFASLGFALVSLTGEGEAVHRLGLVRTSKSAKKQRVRAADDNFRRAQEIARELRALLTDTELEIAAICAESMSFPRSSSVAAKVAMVWGVLADIAEHFGCPVLMATPQEVKQATTARKDSSKEEVQSALGVRYGLLDGHLVGIPKGQHEHPVDALASVVACLNTDVVRMARKQASAGEVQSVRLL